MSKEKVIHHKREEYNKLPEAPASVTYSVTSPKGYGALVTVRDEKMSILIEKMVFMEDWFEGKGYTPQKKGGFKPPAEYVEGKTCPKCSGRVVKKIKKDGKPYHKCENGKWDAVKNQAYGCDWVDWLEPKQETIPTKDVNDIPDLDESDYIM